MAHEEASSPDEVEPFGTWLVAISRPGIDLDAAIEVLRAAPLRPTGLE